jgi:predicted porin
MKKHLIALAVSGALAAPAFAQNVTLYGNIGVGYSSTETNGGNNVGSTNNQDDLGSSVFGIKGSEDLGGGMKADFHWKKDIIPDTGADVTAATWNAESTLGLSNAMGRVSFGRQGPVIDSHKSHANMGANFFSNTDADLNSFSTQYNSTLRVDLAPINGFTLSASNSQSDAVEDVVSYAVGYKIGGLGIVYAYAENNFNETEATLNFSYKLGSVDLAAQLMSGEDGSVDQDLWKIGASIPVTGNLKILASLQGYDEGTGTTGDGTATAANTEDAMGLMAVYSLSKRTSMWAGYNDRDQGGSNGVKEFSVGVQHSF